VEVALPPRRFTPEEEEYSHHKWNINNLPRNRVITTFPDGLVVCKRRTADK
jgi:hypothetical protein